MDFSADRYGSQPYHYIIIALDQLNKSQSQERYYSEIPTAQICSILANQNRNPKKKSKPYNFKDFCFFKPVQDKDLPKGRYGSAAMTLIQKGSFPSWAMFCIPELKESAIVNYIPPEIALISEDAILLHPVQTETGYVGFLIARESASKQSRIFLKDDGTEISLKIPNIETKIVALEGVILSP